MRLKFKPIWVKKYNANTLLTLSFHRSRSTRYGANRVWYVSHGTLRHRFSPWNNRKNMDGWKWGDGLK